MNKPNPYQRTQAITESPRELELRVLRTVNYSLKKAIEENDQLALIRAATNNYLIWQTFLHDVASEDNKLPRDLRRSIAIVAKSVLREIDDNLSGTLDVGFLVNINETVIEGLASSGTPA